MIRKMTLARRTLVCGVLSASLVAVGACSSDDDDGPAAVDTGSTDMDMDMDMDTDMDTDMDADGDMTGTDDMDMDTDDDGDDDAVQETENDDGTSTFIVPLSGEQEVPPVDVESASGEGNLTIDRASGVVTGSVVVSGLTGQAQMAHIHQGFGGVNGPVLIGLVGNDDGTEWSAPEGDDGILDTAGLAALAAGQLYLNVHTEANPGGEVRGQIIPAGILFEDSELSGDEEVPPVPTTASGVGVSTVDEESGAISATVITEGVTATMAHIHVGVEGENGDVIIPLEQDAENASIWRTPEGATLTAEQITAYEAEGLYFNVHSDAYPSGEIRGQL